MVCFKGRELRVSGAAAAELVSRGALPSRCPEAGFGPVPDVGLGAGENLPGYQNLNGGCFKITNNQCDGCDRYCVGSVDGSSDFLCLNYFIEHGYCAQTSGCPTGLACQTKWHLCFVP